MKRLLTVRLPFGAPLSAGSLRLKSVRRANTGYYIEVGEIAEADTLSTVKSLIPAATADGN